MLQSLTRTISALVAAAAIAGALTVLPGASETVSASAPLNSGKGDRLDVRTAGPKCSEQAWPYFETTCIKDRRDTMSRAKTVRVVTTDRVTDTANR